MIDLDNVGVQPKTKRAALLEPRLAAPRSESDLGSYTLAYQNGTRFIVD